ncbi:MAG: acylneuraminate cytidylyltransferase family protein [Desulfobulbaceae bacterium]|nr:acylneuraminate cytidylyltransferase family protein [Desulfobulbaceae bacterium]
MKILGLIPARGGSKGIPRKNIKLLHGKPLLCYTARAGLESTLLTKTILSTEDGEIAQTGRDCGLEVPFLRPAELAEDQSPTLPVILHALDFLAERGEEYDAVCLLQPTSPFRDGEVIDACIRLFMESSADTLITIVPFPKEYSPYFMYCRDNDGVVRNYMGEKTKVVRRQDVEQPYLREGSVYITSTKVLRGDKTIYGEKVVGYPMDPEKSINIDSMDDWQRAEEYLRKIHGEH